MKINEYKISKYFSFEKDVLPSFQYLNSKQESI